MTCFLLCLKLSLSFCVWLGFAIELAALLRGGGGSKSHRRGIRPTSAMRAARKVSGRMWPSGVVFVDSLELTALST